MKAIASLPPGHCLGALAMLQLKFTPLRVPMKMP